MLGRIKVTLIFNFSFMEPNIPSYKINESTMSTVYELFGLYVIENYFNNSNVHQTAVHDGDNSSELLNETIIFKGYTIPIGSTKEEIKKRKEIIFDYYAEWKKNNPLKYVYNDSIKANINIRQESVIEAAEHASKRLLSTLAVLRLDEVLSEAKLVGENKPKPGNKNQSKLTKMLLMEYDCNGIGTVKLTVGVRLRSKEKIQYGITAKEKNTPVQKTEVI